MVAVSRRKMNHVDCKKNQKKMMQDAKRCFDDLRNEELTLPDDLRVAIIVRSVIQRLSPISLLLPPAELHHQVWPKMLLVDVKAKHCIFT